MYSLGKNNVMFMAVCIAFVTIGALNCGNGDATSTSTKPTKTSWLTEDLKKKLDEIFLNDKTNATSYLTFKTLTGREINLFMKDEVTVENVYQKLAKETGKMPKEVLLMIGSERREIEDKDKNQKWSDFQKTIKKNNEDNIGIMFQSIERD